MILETIPAIQHLTAEQKIRLSWELADDVSKATEVRPEVLRVLDERLDAYEADPAAVKSTNEVTAGILEVKRRLVGAAA